MQCNIEFTQHEENYESALSSESETEDNEENNDDDLHFESNKEDNSQDIAVTPSKSAFIVYWTSFLVLLKHCFFPACVLTTIITYIANKGSQLIVKMKCPEGRTTTWKSQSNFNHYLVGNLTSAASVLFSANTYKRPANFFDLAGIQWLSKTSYYVIQKKYLMGVINKNYNEKSKEIRRHEKTWCLSLKWRWKIRQSWLQCQIPNLFING